MLTCPILTLSQTQDPVFCQPHPTQVTPEINEIRTHVRHRIISYVSVHRSFVIQLDSS
mgnify:FL=1